MAPGEEALLVRSLEEYVRRVESGEMPDLYDYENELGDTFGDFKAAVEAKGALDAIIEPDAFESMPEEIGPYTIVRCLGRGALGAVYEARHRRLERRVALKLLHEAYLGDPRSEERFKREARISAGLQHDHLVPMYDAGQFDGRQYCAMQLIEGKSLKVTLETDALAATPALFEQFAGLADGVAVMHAREVVHRDIKPANIMVERGGRYVLTDFGLARSGSDPSVTRVHDTVGTLSYMGPEYFDQVGFEPGPKSDIYALGVSLYESLAGRPAFPGRTTAEIIAAIRRGRPTPLRQLHPEISPACERVVRKAMEPNPEDRYASAAAFRDDLLRLAQGDSVQAQPVSAFTRARRQGDRVILALSCLAIVAGLVWFWASTRPAVLRLTSKPRAAVFINGDRVGNTPLLLEVAAGPKTVEYRRDRFKNVTLELDPKPGKTVHGDPTLLPATDDDYVAWAILVAALKSGEGTFRHDLHRGASDFMALWPRGLVRAQDIVPFAFSVDPIKGLPRRGRWVFERNGVSVWSARAEAVDGPIVSPPIPRELIDTLVVGDEVRWGFRPRSGTPRLATFRVMAEPAGLTEELDRVDRRWDGRDPFLRAVSRALAFSEHDLWLAADRELRPFATDAQTPAQRAIVYGYRERFLRKLKLVESRPYDDMARAVEGLPADVRATFFPDPLATATPDDAGR